MSFEYNLSGKWVELLKQVAPNVSRAGILRDAKITSGIGQFAVIQSVAPSVGIDVSPIGLGDSGEIEGGISAFARFGNGGLIATASAATVFIAISSSGWRRDTSCPRSTRDEFMLRAAA